MKRLGIFGSWRPMPGDHLFELAKEVGRLATEVGWQIVTGGYSGIMEAACRGSVEADGKPVGITCPEINQLMQANSWVRELVAAPSLSQRQALCLARSNAVLFFPGRTGTAAELAQAVELHSKGELAYPIILFTPFWESYFAWLDQSNNSLIYSADELSGVKRFVTVTTAAEVIDILTGAI